MKAEHVMPQTSLDNGAQSGRQQGASPSWLGICWRPLALTTVAFAYAVPNLWYMLNLEHAEGLSPLQAEGYGSAHAAALHAAWPVHAPTTHKLAYFVRNFPSLFLHRQVLHWSSFDACMAATLIAYTAVTRLLLPPTARTFLLVGFGGWVACFLTLPTMYLACWSGPGADPDPGGGAGCGQLPARASIFQCPPCTSVQLYLEYLQHYFRDAWRLGLVGGLLLLPPPLQALASGTHAGALWVMVVAIVARYGGSAARLAHAPVPLTWRAFAAVAATPEFVALGAKLAVQVALLPTAISVCVHWHQRQAEQRRGRRGSGGGGGAVKAPPAPADGEQLSGGGGDTASGAGSSAAAAASIGAPAARAAAQRANPLTSWRRGAAAAAAPSPSPPPPPPPPVALADGVAVEKALARRAWDARWALACAPDSGALTGAGGSALYRSIARRALVSVKLVAAPGCELPSADALHAAVSGAVLVAISGAAAAAAAAAAAHSPGAAPPPPPLPASAAAAAAAPLLQSYAGFPGCYHALAAVEHLPEALDPAPMLAMLEALLPAEAQVLAADLVGSPQQAAAAAGAWCEPVALLRGGGGDGCATQEVLVSLPHATVAAAAAPGRALRVVVGAAGGRGAPLLDATLALHAGGGARGDGASHALQLELQALPATAGPLLLVHLLATARPAGEEGEGGGDSAARHAADAPLLTLPLLVLPAAARAEVEALWTRMVAAWLGHALPAEAAEAGAAAAAAAAAAGAMWSTQMVPLVMDMAAVLQHGPHALPAHAGAALVDFLAGNGMHACLELVAARGDGAADAADAARSGVSSAAEGDGASDDAGVAAPAAAAPAAAAAAAAAAPAPAPASCAGAGAHGAAAATRDAPPAPPPRGRRLLAVAAAASLLGFASPPQERAFRAWKAQLLRPYDEWVMAADALRLTLLALARLRARFLADGSLPSAAWVLRVPATHAAAYVLPPTAMILWSIARGGGGGRAGRRARAAVWAAGALQAGACVLLLALREYGWRGGAGAAGAAPARPTLRHRPLAPPCLEQVVVPALLQLPPIYQALATVGKALVTHALFVGRGCAPLPGWGVLAFAALSVLVCSALDVRLRRRFLALGGAQGAGGASLPPRAGGKAA